MVTRVARLVAGVPLASGRSRFAALLLALPAILLAQHALNRNAVVSGSTSPAAATAPTFCKQVAPILFQHCAQCHKPGEIASSVSLLTYDSARPWARALREKVLLREMPPWPPDPHESVMFRNDTRLSQEDIHTLVAW